MRTTNEEDLGRFFPRVTIMVLGGIALFLLTSGLYVLPVLLEPAPPGAIPDYQRERVVARLDGKVPWFLAGSFLSMALFAGRGWLPGTRRK
ncbi:MAG: hypothetical protein GY725_05195 [bacterium]|nr:hypothetical protein [bacterium]